MVRENTEVVRQPLAVRPKTRRGMDQRLYLRLPGVATALFRAGWRLLRALPPRSRLRRTAFRILLQRSCEALNRRDLEVFSIFVHPEIESVNTPQVVALGGLVPGSHGRAAWIEGQRRWLDDWDELRYEPHEVLDFGNDQMLVLGRIKATGRSSGIVVNSEWGLLASVSDGQLAREQNFLDRAEALEAVGLGE